MGGCLAGAGAGKEAGPTRTEEVSLGHKVVPSTLVAHQNPPGDFVKSQKPRDSDFSVWSEAQTAMEYESSTSSRVQGHCAS